MLDLHFLAHIPQCSVGPPLGYRHLHCGIGSPVVHLGSLGWQTGVSIPEEQRVWVGELVFLHTTRYPRWWQRRPACWVQHDRHDEHGERGPADPGKQVWSRRVKRETERYILFAG